MGTAPADRIPCGVSKPSRQHDNARQSPAYPAPVERLLIELTKLPGIGRRSAERLAFHVLKGDKQAATQLARAIVDVKSAIGHCSVCSNLTEHDPCPICDSDKRDRSKVLVVEQPRDTPLTVEGIVVDAEAEGHGGQVASRVAIRLGSEC